jgi:hypothetical protein
MPLCLCHESCADQGGLGHWTVRGSGVLDELDARQLAEVDAGQFGWAIRPKVFQYRDHCVVGVKHRR